jgi:hypothetical protein
VRGTVFGELAVTPFQDGNGNVDNLFTVTHLKTGYAIVGGPSSPTLKKTDAITIARELSKLSGWGFTRPSASQKMKKPALEVLKRLGYIAQ